MADFYDYSRGTPQLTDGMLDQDMVAYDKRSEGSPPWTVSPVSQVHRLLFAILVRMSGDELADSHAPDG
ncbi:hypothetical protein OUZ56_033485 [Daphnia magna]|uniref:Uncharacterized protein n=1 Tax=Daphnia magna TaxID=35525 RepID=A0ABQ9ZYK3_9CRUS|nr:hypothetical protein OUZ56_033485 [Daphnia magna]